MEWGGAADVTCHSCGMFVFLPKQLENYLCSKCKLIPLLEDKVQQLEAQLATLKSIQELETFVNAAHKAVLEEQHTEQQPPWDISEEGSLQVHEALAWRNVTHRTRKPRDCSVNLELHNRFQVLSQMEEVEYTEAVEETECLEDLEQQEWIVLDECMEEENASKRNGGDRQSLENEQVTVEESPCREENGRSRKRRVVVVGDSLLRGTESGICRPDKMSREVCCLPGAKIHHVNERLKKLIRPADRYPLLLIHVGTNDTAKHSLQKIKTDFEALGRTLRDLQAQVVISSLLPVEGYGPQRERKIAEVNNWLRKWCRQEQFGFLDHGLLFLEDGLLAQDGLHLTAVGKNVFAKRLANLIRRALN